MAHKPEREVFSALLREAETILDGGTERDEKLLSVCRLLRLRVSHYHWVGFYLVESPESLSLGPYDGALTEHTHIPFGKGICGQAAERGETFVVQDVSAEMNYLSCSAAVKSEIVAPMFCRGVLVGELDIDSHELAPFSEPDREFLEAVCELAGRLFR